MLIRKLLLENFGLYGGKHEFDLVPRVRDGRHRPIILFGGKNGAGKTTILEAIQLALYGKTTLGPRVRQADYEAHLRGRIHRSRSTPIQSQKTRVAIEFDYVLRGDRKTYYVERSWGAVNGSGASESFSVMRRTSVARDYEPLDDVESEFWQAFVRDIVPEGLSQLFFFDGEKIKQMAEDSTGDRALADSIKSLLGLDMVERLDADLAIYASRQIAKSAGGEDGQRLAAIEQQIQTANVDLIRVEEEIGATTTKMHGLQAETRRAEEDLRREGHDFASQRDKAVSSHASLTSEIQMIEKQIRGECEGLFPLALCPRVAHTLERQLEKQHRLQRQKQLAVELKGFGKELTARVFQSELGSKQLKAAVRKTIQDAVQQMLESRLGANAAGESRRPLYQVSEADAQQLWSLLREASTVSRSRMEQLCRGLERANRKLREAQKDLARVPESDAIKPFVEKLGQLRQDIGVCDKTLATQNDARAKYTNELTQLQRQRERLLDAYRGVEDHDRRMQSVKLARSALTDYLRRLTDLKVKQLQEAVAIAFNKLCRKGDVLRRIEIDPVTFRTTLFDAFGHNLPKEELSSGEKQIYAVAMLWGLAKTSGRPLPVIVDTPLGRLDSDHRRHLMDHYFPHASHQVILLSTDTEIDLPLFQSLTPHISHVYHLQFDPKVGGTVAAEEYFWKEVVHA